MAKNWIEHRFSLPPMARKVGKRFACHAAAKCCAGLGDRDLIAAKAERAGQLRARLTQRQ